jgi:hypothetical protein
MLVVDLVTLLKIVNYVGQIETVRTHGGATPLDILILSQAVTMKFLIIVFIIVNIEGLI